MGEITTFDRDLRFLGVEIGCRMTIIDLDGDLLLHSPIDVELDQLPAGTPRWFLSPNKMHHLSAGLWLDRGLEGWAAPGLPEKRPDLSFHHVVTEPCEPWGDRILLMPTFSFSLTNEVVLLHRPSKTLVVTDLAFHFTESYPWLTRASMAVSGAYPGCKVSILEKVGMKRDLAREEIGAILELDFDRLILSHGESFETGGKDQFRGAYRWLGF